MGFRGGPAKFRRTKWIPLISAEKNYSPRIFAENGAGR